MYRRGDIKTAWVGHAVFILLLDYLVYLDLFYKSTSSVVCLTIADDYQLAIDDALADIGVVVSNILNRTLNWIVVEFH